MVQGTQYIATTVAASAPTLWEKAAALSTVAVALFAAVELGRVVAARWTRRAEADARVSVIAYGVRRQIRSWLALETAPHFVQWKADMAPALDRVADRICVALTEVHSSPKVRAALRGALLRWYHALDTFDQLPSRPDQFTLDKAARAWGGLSTLRSDVESCAESLTAAIDPQLEAADKAVAHQLREPEGPSPDALEVPEGK